MHPVATVSATPSTGAIAVRIPDFAMNGPSVGDLPWNTATARKRPSVISTSDDRCYGAIVTSRRFRRPGAEIAHHRRDERIGREEKRPAMTRAS
jgi:hypothetical protein